jgi:hypothetical protein
MDKDLFVCQIYADDIIFDSTNKSFLMSLAKLWSIGLKCSWWRFSHSFLDFKSSKSKMRLLLAKRNILKKCCIDKAKPIKTPMGTNDHLGLDMGDTSVDWKVYHSMIGSLLYLCASRLDIMLSVCMCVWFQAATKDCHLRTVKRIMRYVVLTHNLGLWYPKGSHFDRIGYSDGDYVRCKVDRKSTSETC